MKIIHDKNKCIGCGACTAVCPANWKMTNDNKAEPKKTELSEDEIKCNKEAEQVCPVNCIIIK
jgi:ferredoxin